MSNLPKYQFQKIGTDAEVFLRKISTNTSVPVIGLLGGTKENPKPVSELGPGFFVQEDGVAAEFNVPPADNEQDFATSINTMLGYLENYFKEKSLKLDIRPHCRFTTKQLNHPQTVVGCEPDFCVWDRKENVIDKFSPFLVNNRTAAAHVHVSFLVDGKPPSILQTEPIIMGLDLLLGVPSIFMDNGAFRRNLYGQAGAWRVKPYGLEWRVLSNFWIKHPELVHWVFNGVQKVFHYINSGNPWWASYGKMIRYAINIPDKKMAAKLMRMADCVTIPQGFQICEMPK